MLNRSVRAPKGVPRMGDKRYGAACGSRISWPFVCSYEVADRLAALAGLDREHAHRYVIAMGKAMHAMLLSGQPVGIPHVGVLHMDERTTTVYPQGIIRYHAEVNGVRASGPAKPYKVRKRFVRLTQPLSMRRFFDENAVYTAPVEDHVARKREYLKRRLRKHRKGGGLQHTKGA